MIAGLSESYTDWKESILIIPHAFVETAAAIEETETEAVVETEEMTDDLELIAVITAAIAAQEGTSTDGFVVRSIRRRTSNNW